MLDELGFVAELNGTNLFMIKNNVVYTPKAHACLPGITRNSIIDLCVANTIEIKEENLTLSQFINADAVFGTGTMGEITPIVEIDGRTISKESSLLQAINTLFNKNVRNLCEPIWYKNKTGKPLEILGIWFVIFQYKKLSLPRLK